MFKKQLFDCASVFFPPPIFRSLHTDFCSLQLYIYICSAAAKQLFLGERPLLLSICTAGLKQLFQGERLLLVAIKQLFPRERLLPISISPIAALKRKPVNQIGCGAIWGGDWIDVGWKVSAPNKVSLLFFYQLSSVFTFQICSSIKNYLYLLFHEIKCPPSNSTSPLHCKRMRKLFASCSPACFKHPVKNSFWHLSITKNLFHSVGFKNFNSHPSTMEKERHLKEIIFFDNQHLLACF